MTKQSLKILQQKASITVSSEQEFPMECWEGRLPPAMETADVFQRLSGNRHGSPKIWRFKYFQLSE